MNVDFIVNFTLLYLNNKKLKNTDEVKTMVCCSEITKEYVPRM